MTTHLNSQPNAITLPVLGWKPCFQQQLTLEDYDTSVQWRVMEHHRDGYLLFGEQGEFKLKIKASLPKMTVGDWVLLDHEQRFVRLLDRRALFKRKAAGSKLEEQYIAANIDTVFIVTSLNQDFNLSRIERYLAIAREAEVEPVIVLTKQDLCDDADEKRQQVQNLDMMLMVESVNALDAESVKCLHQWCTKGNTVAFMGSSGVGKSTLVNTLLGQTAQATGGIREDDSKGRHTTTSRSMHFLSEGGLLLDTPGMRELQLADCEDGVEETFSDVTQLEMACRFGDCQHEEEPGCAVREAIASGELDERRLVSYFKLKREQARNGASLAEQRAKNRQFTKEIKGIQSESRRRKKGQ